MKIPDEVITEWEKDWEKRCEQTLLNLFNLPPDTCKSKIDEMERKLRVTRNTLDIN